MLYFSKFGKADFILYIKQIVFPFFVCPSSAIQCMEQRRCKRHHHVRVTTYVVKTESEIPITVVGPYNEVKNDFIFEKTSLFDKIRYFKMGPFFKKLRYLRFVIFQI